MEAGKFYRRCYALEDELRRRTMSSSSTYQSGKFKSFAGVGGRGIAHTIPANRLRRYAKRVMLGISDRLSIASYRILLE